MPGQAQSRGGGTGPTHSQPGARRRLVVNITLWPLYLEEDLVPIVQMAEWAMGRVWTAGKTLPLHRFNPQTIQPVVNPYPDYTIPATI